MQIQYILYLLAFGGAAGLLSGLVGIGGGFVVVPLLLAVLPHLGVPPESVMKAAIGTSMAVMIPTSLGSLIHEHRTKKQFALDRGLVKSFCLPAALGGAVGTFAVGSISSTSLTLLFSLYLGYASLLMIRTPRPMRIAPLASADAVAALSPTGPSFAAIEGDAIQQDMAPSKMGGIPTPIVGTAIGALAAMVGLGGASMTVLYLTGRRYSIHAASNISNAIGLSLALSATAAVAVTGTFSQRVHVPAMVLMAVAAIITSAVGVRLKQRLGPNHLRQIFGAVMLVVAAATLIKLFA